MDVKDVKVRKTLLELKLSNVIGKALEDFTKETGVAVKSIDIYYRAVPIMDGSTEYFIDSVKCGLEI